MRKWPEIAAACRPMEGDVLHPDDCVVIRIRGVEWFVRPLQLPEGIAYTPVFGDKVEFKQTVDPLGNEPMQERAAKLVEFAAGVLEGLGLVSEVCGYLSALLDQQYELSDEIKGELLCFRGDDLPPWIFQALRHAHGISPQQTHVELVEALAPPPEIVPKKRRWFWNR